MSGSRTAHLLHALLIACILSLIPVTAAAMGEVANQMCSPYFEECPCGQIPNPKKGTGQPKCIQGVNKHDCQVGVCYDVTSKIKTQGVCVAENKCEGRLCDGKPCEGKPEDVKVKEDEKPAESKPGQQTGSAQQTGSTPDTALKDQVALQPTAKTDPITGEPIQGDAASETTPGKSQTPGSELPAPDRSVMDQYMKYPVSGIDTPEADPWSKPASADSVQEFLNDVQQNADTSGGFLSKMGTDIGSALERWGIITPGDSVSLQPVDAEGNAIGDPIKGDLIPGSTQSTGFDGSDPSVKSLEPIVTPCDSWWSCMVERFGVLEEAKYRVDGKTVTFYGPVQGGDSMQGGLSTSRAGLDGTYRVSTLDDVRRWIESGGSQGKPYVTLATAPENNGKFYSLGEVSYKSNIDGQQYTLKDVVGYSHDTGGAFTAGGCGDYGTCGVRLSKIDVAEGVYSSGSRAVSEIQNNMPEVSSMQQITKATAYEIMASAANPAPESVPMPTPRPFGLGATEVSYLNYSSNIGNVSGALQSGLPVSQSFASDGIPSWVTDAQQYGIASTPEPVFEPGQTRSLAQFESAPAGVSESAYEIPVPESAALSGEQLTADVRAAWDSSLTDAANRVPIPEPYLISGDDVTAQVRTAWNESLARDGQSSSALDSARLYDAFGDRFPAELTPEQVRAAEAQGMQDRLAQADAETTAYEQRLRDAGNAIPKPETYVQSGEQVTADIQRQNARDTETAISNAVPMPDTYQQSGEDLTKQIAAAAEQKSWWQNTYDTVRSTWNDYFGTTPAAPDPSTYAYTESPFGEEKLLVAAESEASPETKAAEAKILADRLGQADAETTAYEQRLRDAGNAIPKPEQVQLTADQIMKDIRANTDFKDIAAQVPPYTEETSKLYPVTASALDPQLEKLVSGAGGETPEQAALKQQIADLEAKKAEAQARLAEFKASKNISAETMLKKDINTLNSQIARARAGLSTVAGLTWYPNAEQEATIKDGLKAAGQISTTLQRIESSPAAANMDASSKGLVSQTAAIAEQLKGMNAGNRSSLVSSANSILGQVNSFSSKAGLEVGKVINEYGGQLAGLNYDVTAAQRSIDSLNKQYAAAGQSFGYSIPAMPAADPIAYSSIVGTPFATGLDYAAHYAAPEVEMPVQSGGIPVPETYEVSGETLTADVLAASQSKSWWQSAYEQASSWWSSPEVAAAPDPSSYAYTQSPYGEEAPLSSEVLKTAAESGQPNTRDFDWDSYYASVSDQLKPQPDSSVQEGERITAEILAASQPKSWWENAYDSARSTWNDYFGTTPAAPDPSTYAYTESPFGEEKLLVAAESEASPETKAAEAKILADRLGQADAETTAYEQRLRDAGNAIPKPEQYAQTGEQVTKQIKDASVKMVADIASADPAVTAKEKLAADMRALLSGGVADMKTKDWNSFYSAVNAAPKAGESPVPTPADPAAATEVKTRTTGGDTVTPTADAAIPLKDVQLPRPRPTGADTTVAPVSDALPAATDVPFPKPRPAAADTPVAAPATPSTPKSFVERVGDGVRSAASRIANFFGGGSSPSAGGATSGGSAAGGGIGSMLGSMFGNLFGGSGSKSGSGSSQSTSLPYVQQSTTPVTTTTATPAVALVANPASVDRGNPSTISWTAVGSAQCILFAPDGVAVATGTPSGTYRVENITSTVTYKVTCSGGTGSTNGQINVIMR